MSKVVAATYSSILFADKILLKNIVPYPKYRALIFTFKYFLLPSIPYIYARNYF